MSMTNGVHRMNRGLNAFLLAISPLALKIGLILGTISLLLGGVLAQNGYFQWAWAIIQAVGVDSVFLITARLFLTVKWRSWDKLTFGVLTLLYGSVALLALNIVSYQELRASTLASAMTALNIDLGVFTTLRSIVIVGTIALFYLIEDKANTIYGLGHQSSIKQQDTIVRIVEADEQPKQIERPGSNEQQVSRRVTQEDEGLSGMQPMQPNEVTHATQAIQGLHQEATQVTQESNSSQPIATQEDEGLNLADNPTYQRVYDAYQTLTQAGEGVTAARIVELSGVGLSSAKKYLRMIR